MNRWQNEMQRKTCTQMKKKSENLTTLSSELSDGFISTEINTNDSKYVLVDEMQCTLIALILFSRFSLALSTTLKSEFISTWTCHTNTLHYTEIESSFRFALFCLTHTCVDANFNCSKHKWYVLYKGHFNF